MRIILADARASMGEELWLDLTLHEISRCGVRLRLAPKVFMVAAALLCARAPLSAREMAEYLYDEEDGGPELALATVRVWVMQARRGLSVFGVEVEGGPFGWRGTHDVDAAEEMAQDAPGLPGDGGMGPEAAGGDEALWGAL